MPAVRTQKGNKMRKKYGEQILNLCYNCCNCQLKKRGEKDKICIAYSNEAIWDENEVACGLFNKAFRGIRPQLAPLNAANEVAAMRKAMYEKTEPDGEQETFFDSFKFGQRGGKHLAK